MKKLLSFVAALTLTLWQPVQAADTPQTFEDPYKMMEFVADKTFQRIAREQAEIKKNPEILRTIVNEEMVPYIDSGYASRYVIGNSLKLNTVDKAELANFEGAFRDYMVGTYAGVFTQYHDQKVIIEPGQMPDAGKKIITIKTRVIDPGKPDINIEFKLKKGKNTNTWLVYDMVAEGISLLDSKRSELSNLIKQQGLTSVASLLKEKAKAPIKAPEKNKNA